MFHPHSTTISAFVSYSLERFQTALPAASEEERELLETSTKSALEILLQCDCPYHDVEHTMLAVDIGQTMLVGRQISKGDIQASDWLHAIIALLFHDIGYVRDLLSEDAGGEIVIDPEGQSILPPAGSTDAYLTPFHVTRGCMYVRERFRDQPLLDVDRLERYIEATRFPVPKHKTDEPISTVASLVRAADLLGQMADPLYLKKLSRLFAEFLETGEAARLGFSNAGQLKAHFPTFFESQVRPFVDEGLKCLSKTQDGQQWISNLTHHLHADDLSATPKRAALSLAQSG